MEPDNFETPQKIIRSHLIQNYKQNLMQHSNIQNESANKVKPTGIQSPTGSLYKQFCNTPVSLKKSSKSAFNVFPIVHTPPNRNFNKIPKIINPFEQHLAERLHLPLICSPSLFQRPATPQLCSTQFEWTIEEVSSLGPANVEPHETQFQDSLDPDMEAKTQAAISSYFKENVVLPSPSDCPIKCQYNPKLLDESFTKRIKRVRDGIAQTILTLPPVLPQEIENALRPYMNFNVDQQQSPELPPDYYSKLNKIQIIDYEARDASLRRKLFDIPFNCNQIDDTIDGVIDELFDDDCEALSPAPKTPEMEATRTNCRLFDNDSLHKNSFGFLSPISKDTAVSTPIKKHQKSFLQNSLCELKGSKNILRQLNDSSVSLYNNVTNKSIFRSTPDLSPIKLTLIEDNENSIPQESSIILLTSNSSRKKSEMLVDNSFNSKISRLMVTSCIKKSKSEINLSTSYFNETDDFDMQISQYSNKSSNNSSICEQTPKSKRRSANRKNLSHSFSIYSDDDDEINLKNKKILKRCSSSIENNSNNIKIIKESDDLITTNILSNDDCTNNLNNFYRMDSGFNEIDNNDELIQKNKILIAKIYDDDDDDESMICCSSTPSKNKI